MNRRIEEGAWSGKALIYSLVAAFFGSLYLANDTFVMHHLIKSEDQFTAVSVYLVLGSWVIMFSTLVYNAVLGRRLDKDYRGFSFGDKKMQFHSILCGVVGSVSTLFCVMGNQKLDSSLVTSLSNVAILYIAFYDTATKRISLREILFPILLVIVGTFLVSMDGKFKVSWIGILILVLLRSSTDATEKIFRQRGVRGSDSVTFNLWRSFWFTIASTVIMISIECMRGFAGQFFELFVVVGSSILAWIFMSLTGLCVFFCFVYVNKAIQIGAVSKVCVVTSAEIIFGIPVILVVNYFWPGSLGEIPASVSVWICRCVGAVVIGVGIYKINKKHGEKCS